MANFDWHELLIQWSRELIAANEFIQDIPLEIIASRWLGYPGATEDQIAQAEARLGAKLPPSYREFLKVTNGWRQLNYFICKLWSTDEIEWLVVRHRNDLINPWLEGYTSNGLDSMSISDEKYLVYGEEHDPDIMRVEYLQTALEISDMGDAAILLLNPQILTMEGEWEAWFFASWLPGTKRYPSFWEMMQSEHQSFLDLLEDS
ncbi:MAG: SMI1/KNR4 family protein [Gloeocapsa sp. UFS-A4-WI-NPMV-4B04]|nr:SMI1/KNR4 family protein [Gloeocapsa sp. UFS-A4-WI-NPMV-4B04]